ncbi:MAG: DNA polymerase ligase N-terminal domain-containing protein [Thermoplasmata archaeon]
MRGRRKGRPGAAGKQTTLDTAVERGAEGTEAKREKENQRAGAKNYEAPRTGPGASGGATPTPELSSDFAQRFREMEVDREAMRNYYVIHEHSSRRLHWDLRLERDGVLKSWAIPKEPPSEPGVKRLAVATEDHPLGYGTFEGEIPPGNYGAGTVRIWDSGRYEPVEIAEGKWVFNLRGRRLEGRYCLIRLKPRPGERQESWLFFKTG